MLILILDLISWLPPVNTIRDTLNYWAGSGTITAHHHYHHNLVNVSFGGIRVVGVVASDSLILQLWVKDGFRCDFSRRHRRQSWSHTIVWTKVVMQNVAQLGNIRSTSIKWNHYIINLQKYRINALVQCTGGHKAGGLCRRTLSQFRGDSYILQTLDILQWFTKKAETDIICRGRRSIVDALSTPHSVCFITFKFKVSNKIVFVPCSYQPLYQFVSDACFIHLYNCLISVLVLTPARITPCRQRWTVWLTPDLVCNQATIARCDRVHM